MMVYPIKLPFTFSFFLPQKDSYLMLMMMIYVIKTFTFFLGKKKEAGVNFCLLTIKYAFVIQYVNFMFIFVCVLCC